jgi:hypothetical protein
VQKPQLFLGLLSQPRAPGYLVPHARLQAPPCPGLLCAGASLTRSCSVLYYLRFFLFIHNTFAKVFVV